MPDLYTRFVANVLFPLQERCKRHDTVRVRRAMEISQWWPRERILAAQFERLRALLRDAGTHTPYYRALFAQSGFDPARLQDIADLQRLPFLTKAIIRANTAALRAENARALARFNTGGSSGEPLIFFIGGERVTHDVAAKWRATRWWGVDIGDPEIVLWGSPIELGAQDRLRMLRDRAMRTRLLPAFEMSGAKVERFIARIRAARPKMLFGYPSALAHIALHAERKGIGLDDLAIAVAFATGERLYDHQRAAIERLYACPVANGYGSRDGGFIAHQCPAGGMHITAEDIIVEIVDENGRVLPPGRCGEIVITHLATRDFPFIRYRTGDIGAAGEESCPCGRGLPLLRDIQGRSTDFVVARDGTVLHGLSLVYVVRDLAGVRAFRIVQESLDLTRVQLAVDPSFDPAGEQRIVAGFRQRLGEAVAVVIERVEAIAPEKSGKYRYIVSHVEHGAPVRAEAG
ncbi:MAG: phenylacetate--CoA ligase family protein [Azoarcus sp.]|jgi:phenylacetate-CoA ligase|nr:phenylacetate--CoA ligase family protein [Azoarcus sp.]